VAIAPNVRQRVIAVAIACLGVLTMLTIAASLGPERLVAGDGHYVFAAARSLAYDGDLDLTNQYRVMGDRWGLGRDPTLDRWRLPPREIGASLLMVPGLWLHWLLGASPRWEPAFACLGAAASLGVTWLGCARALEAARLEHRSWLAAAATFGFVVPFYAVGTPGYTHALDAAIGAWLCWALVARRHPALVGALLGCAVLTRMQNTLWMLWPLTELALVAVRRDRAVLSPALRRCAVIAGLGVLGFLPQIWLGLAHPGSERGAIGWTLAFFNLEDYPRDLVRVLLGAHGLVSWTPIAGLALIGLALGERGRWLGAWVVLAALWLLLASVRDVDGGDAFGARRLAGIVALLALGLGQLGARIEGSAPRYGPRLLAAALTLVVAANLARTHQAIVGELSLASPEPARGPR
jgi:hypothetical protein